MGGFGSGERWSKKTTVESCYSLDTVRLKRWKLLVPGITDRLGFFEWRRGEEEKPSSSVSYLLTVGDHAGTLWLMYTLGSGKESLDYPIRLETTGCHLGGVRWWFTCPLAVNGRVCGRRVRKLYLCGKYFGCRHCHNLTYRSTQESDSRVYAVLRGERNLPAFDTPGRMSVSQLGLALKALALEEKQLERLGKRSRVAGGPTGEVNKG